MDKGILHELAAFLDALPYQVQAWDRKVIEHLARNAEALRHFRNGSTAVKWDVYRAIRYASSN